MLDQARDLKVECIGHIIGHLHKRVDKKFAPSVEQFIRLFYRRATANDLVEDAAENLYGSALSR